MERPQPPPSQESPIGTAFIYPRLSLEEFQKVKPESNKEQKPDRYPSMVQSGTVVQKFNPTEKTIIQGS